MKRLLTIILIIIIVMSVIFYASANNDAEVLIEDTTISEDYIPSEETNEIEIKIISINELSANELKDLMEKQKNKQKEIHQEAEKLRMNNYSDDSYEIQELKKQWNIAQEQYENYKSIYNEKILDSDIYWEEKMDEYPTATYVWRYLKSLGYNDAVSAGIIGNMMLECGGGTLNLIHDIYGGYGFYGLCQWSKTYFPEVYGADLENQMICLENTIKEQIDYAGFVYGGDGFSYEDFLKIEDPGEAAICFALAYERCASQHVWPRRGFAEQAYAYFTN